MTAVSRSEFLPEDPGSWDPWTEVGDREELRRRLELLASFDVLPESEVDFVLFHFRASDPVLYPLAAVVLGRQLGRSDQLSEWLREYARARGLPLGTSIPLSRTRSARRLLLCAAAAVARDPDAWFGLASEEAVTEDTASRRQLAPLPDRAPIDHSQDLATYLRGLRILLGGTRVSREHEAKARQLLETLVEDPERLRDRSVALRWSELLAAAPESDVLSRSEAEALGGAALSGLSERFDAPGTVGVPERLGILRCMDGIIRESRGSVSPGQLRPELSGLGRAPDSDPDGRVRFMGAMERLADPRRWLALSETERAWTAFLVLVGAASGGPASGEIRRILDAFGFPPSPRPVARVLRMLAEREETGLGEFVDATLLHALEDEEILLELVPSGPPGELGAVVADALEHRIRVGVRTEPGFRPDELLARVEARRPHPQLFQLLRTVVGDREFLRPDGESVPLAEWLAALHEEAQALRETGTIRETPPISGPLGALRGGVRRALLRLEGEDDPAALARGVALLLHGGRMGDDPDRSRDLRSLIHALAPSRSSELESALHRYASELREKGPAAIPEELAGAPEARSAAASVRFQMTELSRELAPILPEVEATLMKRVLHRVDQVEGKWLAGLSQVEEAWRLALREHEAGEVRWSRIFASVSEVPLPSHRRSLYPVLWRTLIRTPPSVGADPPQTGVTPASPTRLEGLMRWAIRAGDTLEDPVGRESWLRAVADHWADVVAHGMESGLETRVARLVRDPGPSALALLPGVDQVLERTRVWFFDCYRLGDAARVSRILNHRRGRGAVAALPRDLLGFFLHYSPLWLALLIGAILMLDFGDAWTAMADVGDVRGIGITFALGVLGAFGYVTAELHSRVRDTPGDRVWRNRGARILRVTAFVGVSLIYTMGLVSLLWWLLSGTEEVVHGEGALLHVVVWSGFTLFIGVFFGLMAKDQA